MKKFYFVWLAFILLMSTAAHAQEKAISGTVKDSLGIPIPGVNIIIKSTSTGTQSDFDGNYSINTNVGQILTFSYVGYITQDLTVTSSMSTLNIVLVEDTNILGEVVLTAQGIKKEKRALGYGQTTLKSGEIEQRGTADVAKALQGKVAGITISQTGVTGGGSGIVVRGKSLITENNQALIVVDGVPITTGTNNDGFTGAGDIDSNRLVDIDPNNIASMSVLKGLAATVLYGNQGLNGVILITTKTGSGIGAGGDGKMDISVTANNYFTEVANLPDFQNSYGSGFYLGNINGANNSFGPLFDGSTVPHILSNNGALLDDFPELFDDSSTPDIIEGGIPYVARPNNVSDFFRTGVGRTIGITASKSFKDGSFSGSYSNTSEEGFIPGNQLRRDNFSIGGFAKLSNKFTVNGSLNYVINKIEAPPITAANGASSFSIFNRLLGIARNFDLTNFPYQNPRDGSNVFYLPGVDNPRWILNNSRSNQDINRTLSNFSLKYDLNDNISLTYRMGFDIINESQSFFVNKGSSSGDAIFANGYLREVQTLREQWDHSFILGLDYELSDSIGFTGTVGANSNRNAFKTRGSAYQDQLIFGNILPNNFETVTNDDPFTGGRINNEGEFNIIGLYAQAEFDYSRYLYLTLAARNDWGSLLESSLNSVFYPSASVSFIPTTAFDGFRSENLNYLKLRGNISSGAQFPGTLYSTRPAIVSNSNAFGDGGVATQSVSSFIPNPEIEAAVITDYEVGIEAKFLKNRVSLDASVYRRIAKDQIFNQAVSAETGATSTLVNVGEVQTDGVEVALGITPVKTDDFQWNINATFFADEPIVNELPEGTDRLAIGGFTNLGNFAIEGQPLGVIVGSFAVRDADGNFLINPANGEVIPNSDVGIPDKIIGDPNQDWTSTLINSFTYKGLTLSGQVEYRHGGDIYSLTSNNLYFRGVIDIEGVDREFYAAAVPGVLAAVDEDGAFIVEIDADGNPIGVTSQTANGSSVQNGILLPYEDTIFNNVEQNDAENIYDGSTIRLREVSLSYELPSKLLDKTPFGSVNFKIYGQNLFYKAINFPDALNYDIESGSTGVGNASGLEFRTAPSAKNFGLSVRATF